MKAKLCWVFLFACLGSTALMFASCSNDNEEIADKSASVVTLSGDDEATVGLEYKLEGTITHEAPLKEVVLKLNGKKVELTEINRDVNPATFSYVFAPDSVGEIKFAVTARNSGFGDKVSDVTIKAVKVVEIPKVALTLEGTKEGQGLLVETIVSADKKFLLAGNFDPVNLPANKKVGKIELLPTTKEGEELPNAVEIPNSSEEPNKYVFSIPVENVGKRYFVINIYEKTEEDASSHQRRGYVLLATSEVIVLDVKGKEDNTPKSKIIIDGAPADGSTQAFEFKIGEDSPVIKGIYTNIADEAIAKLVKVSAGSEKGDVEAFGVVKDVDLDKTSNPKKWAVTFNVDDVRPIGNYKVAFYAKGTTDFSAGNSLEASKTFTVEVGEIPKIALALDDANESQKLLVVTTVSADKKFLLTGSFDTANLPKNKSIDKIELLPTTKNGVELPKAVEIRNTSTESHKFKFSVPVESAGRQYFVINIYEKTMGASARAHRRRRHSLLATSEVIVLVVKE
ncbi:hypothetical protein FUAX_29460 [Fulvitalea axinellae]|uniref:DUF4625 domain-containing protein n=1 Tax=Fulvitalea axinellae TaxID=1182444 RepID=A0AAU9CED1_9BACT|nr:hypothetical protein FUAX_29460 [Fulvitalea axinellae]